MRNLIQEYKLEKYLSKDQIALENKLKEMEQQNPSTSLRKMNSEEERNAYGKYFKEIFQTFKTNKKTRKSLRNKFNDIYYNYNSYDESHSKPKVILEYDSKNQEIIGKDENCKWFNIIRIPFEKKEKEISQDCIITRPFKTKREYNLVINIDGHNFYFLNKELITHQKISGMGGMSSYLQDRTISSFYEKKMFPLIKTAEAEIGKTLVDDDSAFCKNPHLIHDDYKLINKNWYSIKIKPPPFPKRRGKIKKGT